MAGTTCPAGHSCTDGLCQRTEGACELDGDCPEGSGCLNGWCGVACETAAEFCIFLLDGIGQVLFALGDSASAEDIRERLTDSPSYSAVRAMLVKLEAKGFIRHREAGLKYVYSSTTPRTATDVIRADATWRPPSSQAPTSVSQYRGSSARARAPG